MPRGGSRAGAGRPRAPTPAGQPATALARKRKSRALKNAKRAVESANWDKGTDITIDAGKVVINATTDGVSKGAPPTHKRWRTEAFSLNDPDAAETLETWFREWCMAFFGVGLYQTQLRAFRIIVKHRRVIILIPREHGKTFLVYLLLAWLLLEHPFWDYYPLAIYFSANPQLVKNAAVWFTAMFARQNIQACYGNVLGRSSTVYQKFFKDELRQTGQKDANLTVAKGANITGMHVDILFFDDILDEKCRRKPTIVADWIAWYSQNASDTLNLGGFEVIVGTRKKLSDFYEHILNLHSHYAHVEKAILRWGEYKEHIDESGIKQVTIADPAQWQISWDPRDLEFGKPKWTIGRLVTKCVEKGKLFFSCEFQNDPASESGIHFDAVDFKRQRFRLDTLPGDEHFLYRDDGKTFKVYEVTKGGYTIVMDPIRGDNPDAQDPDYCAIIVGLLYLGEFYVFEVVMLKGADPEKQCYELLRLYERYKGPFGETPRMYVEHIGDVGDKVLEVINSKGLYPEEIKSQRNKKLGRILWGVKEPIKQKHVWWALHIDKPTWDAYVGQFLSLGVSEDEHDDGPDATEMLVSKAIDNYAGGDAKICANIPVNL